MAVATRGESRSIVERDVWRLNVAAVAYVVTMLIAGVYLDWPVWLIVVVELAVVVLYMAGARFATGRMLRRLALGVAVDVVGNEVPAAIANHLAALQLADFEPPVMVRRTATSGALLIPDVAFLRRSDGAVLLSVAQHVTIARSRLDDGRWVLTQPGDAYPVPGLLVQSVPGRQRDQVLARHHEALRIAASCGLGVVAIETVPSTRELEDIGSEVIAEMTPAQRRRTARNMLGSPGLVLLDADAF